MMARKLLNLVGARFGRLVIKEYLGKNNWRALCDCGNERICIGSSRNIPFFRSCIPCKAAGKAKKPAALLNTHAISVNFDLQLFQAIEDYADLEMVSLAKAVRVLCRTALYHKRQQRQLHLEGLMAQKNDNVNKRQ
jgi:hypothetical protein